MTSLSTLAPAATRPATASRPASNHDELDSVRGEIERVDDRLLELVHERLALAAAAARCKARDAGNDLLIRPDREARVLARLSERSAPEAASAVAGLWRELMAQCLHAQRASAIVIHAVQEPVLVTDAVRLRFGCAAPLVTAADAESALHHARLHPAMAVVELTPLSRWWVELHADPELAIVDGIRAHGRVVALTVGRMAADHAPAARAYAIMSDERLRARTAAGEAWRAIALSGAMRLCVNEQATGGEA